MGSRYESDAGRRESLPWETHPSDVVDSLDFEDAGNALDVGENALELFAVRHVQSDFDARVKIFAAAFQGANIGRASLIAAVISASKSGAILREECEGGLETWRAVEDAHSTANAPLGFV